MHKTVLITGCSSGLGLSIVKTLLANDWRVIATARNLETSDELKNMNHPLLTQLKLDVASKNDREQIKQFIANELNNELDCLINNAGYGLFGAFEELSEAQIRDQLEVNLIGLMLLTQICLPALRKNHGRIINVSSMMGYFVFPMQSLYITSKFALEGFSETLYYELAPHGVQVTLIEPGLYKTSFGSKAKFAVQSLPDYKWQNESLAKFRAGLAERKGGSADELALCVLDLLNRKKMPIRKRLGRDANLVYYVRRILPAPLFNKLLSLIYQRIFPLPAA